VWLSPDQIYLDRDPNISDAETIKLLVPQEFYVQVARPRLEVDV
jgi:hypothetical protein